MAEQRNARSARLYQPLRHRQLAPLDLQPLAACERLQLLQRVLVGERARCGCELKHAPHSVVCRGRSACRARLWGRCQRDLQRLARATQLARASLAQATRASVACASVASVCLGRASVARGSLARGSLARASLARASVARGSLAQASVAGASAARGSLAQASVARGSLAQASVARGSLAQASLARIARRGQGLI